MRIAISVFQFFCNLSLLNSIKPAEIKHYLFKIKSKQNEKITNEQVTGKLDIVWRNPFSDIGRLQTNPMTQTVTLY